MDTETKAPTKLAAIRTYAKDLDSNRNHKASAAAEPVVVETAEQMVKEPVRASDTLTTKVSRVEVPASKPVPKKAPKEVPALKPITPTKNDPTIIMDNEDGAAATIITDTKHDEFKLIPAIINSIHDWFLAKKRGYKAKKIPKYTVPDTTRRKGIIQKATSKTGKFASSDFSSIQERILERKANAAAKALRDDEPDTIWTANTEPGFALLAETTTQKISNVQMVARKSFRATPTEEVPKPEPIYETETETDGPDDNRWAATVRAAAPEVNLPAVAAIDEVEEVPEVPQTPPKEDEVDVIEEVPVAVPVKTNPVKKGRFD
ncbi:MAG: hypothetical protein UW75_C0057G0006, partial [Parcubacteria group bacterium GW2011_GWF2_44_8]